MQEWVEEGASSAEEIILRMLVGVGDPTRKARRMLLLNPGVRVFGASVGKHPISGSIAVLIFAHDFAPHPRKGTDNYEALNYFDRVGAGVVELLQILRERPRLVLERVVHHDLDHNLFGQQVLATGRGVDILRDPATAYSRLSEYLTRQEARLQREGGGGGLQYSRELSMALRLTERIDCREAVAKYGLALGGVVEV